LVKIKVYELAKELDLESKDVIKRLQKLGVEAKSHMASVDNKYADMLRQTVKGKDKVGLNGNFVPKVTRIPKSEVQEQIAESDATKDQGDQKTKAVSKAAVEDSSAPKEQLKRIKEEKASPIEANKIPHTQVISPTITPAPSKEDKPPVQAKTQKPTGQVVSAATHTPDNKVVMESVTRKQTTEQGRPDRASMPAREPLRANSRQQARPSGGQQARPSGSQQSRPSGRLQSRPSGSQQSRPASGAHQTRPSGNQARPAGGGQQARPFAGGYQGKDKPQGRSDSHSDNRNQKSKQAGKKFTTVIEKPTSNYRPEKKVFVKDIIHERSHEEENARKAKFNNYKGHKNNKNLKNKKEAKREMPAVVPKKIIIGETVILGELAKSMSKTAAEVIKKLFEMGIMATINQELDADTAILIADEFGITVEVRADKIMEVMEDIEDDERMLKERPPIVTVMGHVDHGKTSLLDAIRKTDVIATEAGGITQHIGAYQVEIKNKKITFLDTPGHEAFTAMRARGAQITDISVLVVAADDGVMPQTLEAINHSKAAGVPIIVAINKIDKEEANPDRVKQALMEYGLVPEEWGGDTVMVPVSAKTGIGIESLLEMILLVAEVAELKANPKRQARGTVVEAKLDKNRGPVATLLVQKGTLNIGDSILAGAVFGKVRAMSDDKGRKAKTAGPSMPIEVLGFSDVPPAGEIFIAVKDDKDARLVAYKQQIKKREEELRKSSRVSLDDLFKRIEEGEIKELNLILKGDVQGSIEALEQAVVKLNTEEVKVNVIHTGVGGIKESDIMLASASNAIIIGFNVRPDANARKAAEAESVDIRLYRVIYDAINDIKKAMSGLLAPEFKEQVIGHAEVRAVFKVPKVGLIAGSYVTDGKVTRNASVRVIRDSIVIAESKIESLRRFKDDAKEVLAGFECGIGVENYNDVREGDSMEIFIIEEVEREL
jgi:translation initiation factor IF-2